MNIPFLKSRRRKPTIKLAEELLNDIDANFVKKGMILAAKRYPIIVNMQTGDITLVKTPKLNKRTKSRVLNKITIWNTQLTKLESEL